MRLQEAIYVKHIILDLLVDNHDYTHMMNLFAFVHDSAQQYGAALIECELRRCWTVVKGREQQDWTGLTGLS